MSDQYNQTIRDELNEIRAVGPGSRGGKGAKKRRNGRKESTRRQSTKEIEREDLNIAALGVRVAKMFTTKDKKEADKLLIGHFKLAAMEENTVPAFWTAVGIEPGAKFILKGDAQHREALKLVYALAVKVARSDEFDMHVRMITEQLAKRFQDFTRKRQNRKIVTFDDLLRALIRLRIDFGNIDGKDDRHQVWQLTAAIRYFISLKKGPHKVEKHYERYGGGLDEWSRLAPKTTRTDKREAAIEVKVIAEDRDYKPPMPLDMAYYDDDDSSPPVVEPDEAPRITEFESIFLRYCVNTLGLEPGGFRLLGVLGDTAAPLGARIVLSSHIERIGVSPSRLETDGQVIVELAERLLKPTTPKGPYNEDGWLLPDIW